MSLFRRVSRYPQFASVDPRENRLTEAFAALLERVDGLAGALVADWAQCAPPEGRVSVSRR
jgi:hypothetical protein